MATSSTENTEDLKELLEELCKLAVVQKNDTRQKNYCHFVTRFLNHFVNERCMVVGSSEEGTRIRANEDEGDFDYLIISEITIPTTALKYRSDLPCYVNIVGKDIRSHLFDDVDVRVELVEEQYLPSELLNAVHPAAFTGLRGVFEIVKLCGVRIGRQTPHIQIDEKSKPGLALIDFAGLKCDCPEFPITTNNRPTSDTTTTLQCYIRSLERSSLKKDPCLENICQKLVDILRHIGESYKFSQTFGRLLKSSGADNSKSNVSNKPSTPSMPAHDTSTPSLDPSNTESAQSDNLEELSSPKQRKLADKAYVSVKYKYKTHKDFIAAFPLSGRPEGLDEWKIRRRKWPSQQTVDDIFENTKFFVVGKPRQLASEMDRVKEFCLGYNLAEIKLAKALSPTQRKCLLILKVCNRGYLKEHPELTTYHWKTAFYWSLEDEDPAEFTEDNILSFVRNVLAFMKKSLDNKYLEHYFIKSNLFAEISQEVCNEISKRICQLNPVTELREFIRRTKSDKHISIELPRAKMEEAWRIYMDPTNELRIKAMISALEHILRAIRKSKCYQDYRAQTSKTLVTEENPLYKAILDMTEIALDDLQLEKQLKPLKKQKTCKEIPIKEILNAVSKYLKANDDEKEELLNYLILKVMTLITDM